MRRCRLGIPEAWEGGGWYRRAGDVEGVAPLKGGGGKTGIDPGSEEPDADLSRGRLRSLVPLAEREERPAEGALEEVPSLEGSGDVQLSRTGLSPPVPQAAGTSSSEGGEMAGDDPGSTILGEEAKRDGQDLRAAAGVAGAEGATPSSTVPVGVRSSVYSAQVEACERANIPYRDQ